jgi:hypothetical protein
MIPLVLLVGLGALVLNKLEDSRTPAETAIEAQVEIVTSTIAATAVVIGAVAVVTMPIGINSWYMYHYLLNIGRLVFDIILIVPFLLGGLLL